MNKKIFALLVIALICTQIEANDSSYYGGGDQLVPISDSDISVQKEILTIKRNTQDPTFVDVTVYYEFYNSGKAKNIIVGFEAFSPTNDPNYPIKTEGNPLMTNFMIDMNGQKLTYDISAVKDSTYRNNGVINALTQQQIKEIGDDMSDYADFFYVYYFNANFKPGVNIVKHTYSYLLSGGIMNPYNFDYVLSAAMRWGNKQIDDFTLNIDLGKNELFYIPHTFFDDTSEWIIDGIGRSNTVEMTSLMSGEAGKSSEFFIKEGKIIFKKKNFKPKGELSFYSLRYFNNDETFDYFSNKTLPYNYSFYQNGIKPANEISQKILRNLPFAYRGYIFSTPEIQQYYENQFWYYPDPSYKAEITLLPEDQQEWVRYWTSYTSSTASESGVFDYKTTPNICYMAYTNSDLNIQSAVDDTSQKILRNLPFAYRGYIFSNPLLQSYFERQVWYKPNVDYKPEIEELSKLEKDWVERWSE